VPWRALEFKSIKTLSDQHLTRGGGSAPGGMESCLIKIALKVTSFLKSINKNLSSEPIHGSDRGREGQINLGKLDPCGAKALFPIRKSWLSLERVTGECIR